MKTSRAAGTRATRPDDRAASCCPTAPRTVSTAPSLQQAALTPAQKAYLNNIAASHSDARARDLIARHYLNVLRRRAAPGSSHGAGGSRSHVLDADETQPDVHPADKHNKNTKPKSDRTPPSPSCRLTNTSNRRKQKKKSCSSPGARTEDEDEDLDESLSLLSVGERDDTCLENIRRDEPGWEKL